MLLTFRELLNFSNLTIYTQAFMKFSLLALLISHFFKIENSMGHLHETVTWYKNTLQESEQKRRGTSTK